MINKKGKAYANRKPSSERPAGDFYPTPVSLVTCSADLFKSVIPANAIITEPCCGNGQITLGLKKLGYERIIENDLYTEREDILHNDLLHSNLDEWCSEYIVTNFPFSKWDDCVMACLAKENLKALITIGRLNYLSTQSRLKSPMWKHLKEIWIFSRYIDYRTDPRDDGQFNVGAMATGFFYFTKEETDAPVIRFVDVQKYATLGNKEE